MIYIFSSCSYDLFKQNVLNACCLPDGHVLRVRYGEQYIPRSFATKAENLIGKAAVFVFAEGALRQRTAEEEQKALPPAARSTAPHQLDYVFLPIRFCVIKHAKELAGIVVIDIELGKFLDYGQLGDETWRDKWDAAIKDHAERPYLKPSEPRLPGAKDGFYVYEADDLPLPQKKRGQERAWRSLIDRINAKECELSDCITYRVLGFFRANHVLLRRKWPEHQLKPRTASPDSVYRFRTGETVLMRLLFYGEQNSKPNNEELEIIFDPKAFTSVSTTKIAINGRYNEERILLPTVRGTDTILSTLSIAQVRKNSDERRIWAPQPSFVVSVGPSRALIGLVVVLFSLSFFFASLSKLSDLPWLDLIPGISLLPLLLADNPKILAAIAFMIASWLYLRKFPLK